MAQQAVVSNLHVAALDVPTQPISDSPECKALAADILKAWHECRAAVSTGDKLLARHLHIQAKRWDDTVNYTKLDSDLARLRRYFPSGAKIDPSRIDAIVVPVRERTLEERLFKVTRGYWSMPYSKGYGRRMRFLVFDQHHDAVIGIIGLQSPSADLACRDSYLGVSRDRKLSVINSTLDAYTIGSTPTYAPLLAGKLVAGFLHSPVIRREYWRLYGHKKTTNLGRRIPQPLLAITTASAFGRSSIYNRLRDESRVLAKPLGYTKGFGTLHLEELYPRMVAWLKERHRFIPAGFGHGPKVRWQNIMHTLIGLGIDRACLEHGLRREVFIFELVTNIHDACQSNALAKPSTFDDEAWTDFWKERWCVPRAARNPDWYEFDPLDQMRNALRRYAS